jgi:hypothetical protein
MAKRQGESVAAGLLSTWTDSDTAMQIVGVSLGVFGPGLVDPTVALASETPLRSALFDVLLSLVEGGALDMRPSDDGRYAFRRRADLATAALSPSGSTAIDLAVPSPYLADLERARSERDDALTRAEIAEALAAERDRLLRVTDVPSPAKATAAPELPAEPQSELTTLDTRDEGALDALYPIPPKPAPRKAASRKSAAGEPPPPKKARKTKKAAAAESGAGKPSKAPSEVVYLNPPAIDEATDAGAVPSTPVAEVPDNEAKEPRSKWSGYAVDTARPRLSSVDRLVDEA